METEKTAALYVRVSTTDQNMDMQLDGLREHARKAGMRVYNEYVDQGVSGSQRERTQLQKLMQDARDYHFNTVLVWKFDRFARSVTHLLKALEEFNHLGIGFASIKDQVDTKSPIGKAMFVLIGAMAELEGDLIRERVKEGMKAAKSRGKTIGRPKTPTYIVDKIQKLAIETDMSINQIRKRAAQNISRAVIGKIVQKARN